MSHWNRIIIKRYIFVTKQGRRAVLARPITREIIVTSRSNNYLYLGKQLDSIKHGFFLSSGQSLQDYLIS